MTSISSNLISNLNSVANAFTSKGATAETGIGGDFKNLLTEALNRFESIGDIDAQSTFDLLTGNTDDLSNTMIASQKSELALNLVVAIRNKAVEAYKEIMNMQV